MLAVFEKKELKINFFKIKLVKLLIAVENSVEKVERLRFFNSNIKIKMAKNRTLATKLWI